MAPILDLELVTSTQAFLSLFLLTLLSLFILTTIKRSFSSHKHKLPLPPSPPRLPIIGNLHQIGPLPHISLDALASTYGPLMYLRFGRVLALVVSSAELAAEVYKTHDAIFASRPISKVGKIITYNLKDMVFTPYGKYWRLVRRICTNHLFHPKKEETYFPVKEEQVAFMAEKLGEASLQSRTVNMADVSFDYANDVICRLVSARFFRAEGRKALFQRLVMESGALLGAFHPGDFFPLPGWLDGTFEVIKRAKKNFKTWDEVLTKLIKEHREGMKEGHQPEDFTDVLLTLQQDPDTGYELPDEEVKPILMDMFGAGTENTAVTTEWAMAELVRKPKVMKKLVDEVRGIAGQDPKVKTEDVEKMSYLKAVVKETLRLHPPVPLLIPKETMEDCNMKGYLIPKGTRVFINVWTIGRDPNYWESPNEFNPERFINSDVDFRGQNFHLIPFGAGRRICLGMQFAVSTVEIGLATLVHQFDWELPCGLQREKLDMEEAPGLTTPKKNKLKLVPKQRVFPKE